MRKSYVFDTGQRDVWSEHILPAPGDKLRVHVSNQDKRRFLQMPDLEQLPDHHGLEHRADAARHDDKSIDIRTN